MWCSVVALPELLCGTQIVAEQDFLFSPGLNCCCSMACSKQEVLLEQDLVLNGTRCNSLSRESASLALQQWGKLVLPRPLFQAG